MGDFFTKQLTVLDSAVHTQLLAQGMPEHSCAPDWILRSADAFKAIKRADIEAGSDWLYAPTFGATAADFRHYGVRADVRKCNLDLVEMTRELADGRPVGGNIGTLPENGMAFDETVSVFAEQAAALDEAGVDFISIESQASMSECRAAVMAVRSVSEKPILCSFIPTTTARSLTGEDLVAVMLSLQDMGVEAFGINCCINMSLMSRVLTKLRRYAAVPLLAKPAASGNAASRRDSTLTTGKIAAFLPRFIASGARLLGGCCGTDAELVAALRSAVDAGDRSDFSPAESKALAASPYRVVELTPRMKIEELEIDDDIVENASVAEETGAKLLKVVLRDEMDLDTLYEAQFSIRLPLAVRCDDENLLLRFLRLYNGKPVIL